MPKVKKSADDTSLADAAGRILDKGIVIEASVRVSLVGVELITIEARLLISSVDAYVKYADAIGLTAAAAVPA